MELPYQGGELSLILLLPGKISEFITGSDLYQDYYEAIFLIQTTCNISRLERPDTAYLKKYNYL